MLCYEHKTEIKTIIFFDFLGRISLHKSWFPYSSNCRRLVADKLPTHVSIQPRKSPIIPTGYPRVNFDFLKNGASKREVLAR